MNKTLLSLHRFKKLAKKYKTIPVYKKVLADMLTPVSAWLHLSSQVDYAFLFESVEKGNQFNRYSYLGINPISILSHLNGKTVFKSNILYFQFFMPNDSFSRHFVSQRLSIC